MASVYDEMRRKQASVPSWKDSFSSAGVSVTSSESVVSEPDADVPEPVSKDKPAEVSEEPVSVGSAESVKETASDTAETAPEPKIRPVPRRSVVKTVRPESKTVTLHGIPAEVMTFLRNEVPGARNNTEALLAWIYIKSEGAVPVPEGAKELAHQYSDHSVRLDEILKSLLLLNKQMRRVIKLQQDDQYRLAYLVAERMNLIKSPILEDLDLTSVEMDEFKREWEKSVAYAIARDFNQEQREHAARKQKKEEE